MPSNKPPRAGPVPREALRFFRRKGYKTGFDYRDVWREEHATAFTVAKAMDRDVLASIRQAVDQAIAEGRTLQDFQRDLTLTLQRLGWWGRKYVLDPATGERVRAQLGSPRRLRTIYRANIRTARSAGVWDRAQRTKASRPFARYSLGPSKEHRPEHAAWDGLILPLDDPFFDTHWTPNGWGCKCWIRMLSAREAARLGGPSKAPKVRRQPWVNKRTGEVEMVPEGVDPGWDTNPGKVGRPKLAARQLRRKEAAAKEVLDRPAPKPVPGLRDQVKTPDASFEGMTREKYQELWSADIDNPKAEKAFLNYLNLSAQRRPNYGARARAGTLTPADKAMEKAVADAAAPLSRDLTTFRGIRGDHYAHLKIGDEVKFGEVTSTSTSNAWAMRFGSEQFGGDTVDVMFVIRNKRGQKALVAHYGEREITLPAGARLRVTRIESGVEDVPAGLYSWSPPTQVQKVQRVIHLEVEDGS